MMAALKSLTENSNICFIITSMFYLLSFLIQVEVILVFGISDLLLYTGHLGCYIVRHWIISYFSLFQVVDLFSRSKWDGYSALHMGLMTPERRVGYQFAF